jgi:hypothetical protein
MADTALTVGWSVRRSVVCMVKGYEGSIRISRVEVTKDEPDQ